MTVSVDEHEVVPLIVLTVTIHMVYFQYVLVSKEKLATDVAILFRTHGDKDRTQHTRCVR